MTRRLPSLAALQSFEAAARHLSFTRAADELFVTQGAISRRIRDLEEGLEIALFRRLTRQIELTAAGAEFLEGLRHVLGDLESLIDRVGGPDGRRTLTLSSLPTVADAWLMPRLHEFTQAEATFDVNILTSIEPVDFTDGGPNAAIRVGNLPGRDGGDLRIDLTMIRTLDGVHADFLFEDRMVPVCAPALLDGRASLSAGGLAGLPLIHTTTRRHAWTDWFRSQGVPSPPRGDPALEFGHFFMSVQAARKGRGVALVPDIIVAHIAGDDLVWPVPVAVRSAGAYYLLTPKERLRNPLDAAFRSWLLDEAAAARTRIAAMFAPSPAQ